MTPDFLLAIPVFNEEQYVPRVLDRARQYISRILVIDDGSTDGTAGLLRGVDDIRVITHAENRGYGKTLADAFGYARRAGHDWLITMDCDEQHEPSYIPKFMAATAKSDADIISGTRYPDRHDSQPWLGKSAGDFGPYVRAAQPDQSAPPDRWLINARITAILNARLGLGITDAFCGFKAYRVAALRHFQITVPGYAMPMQLWVQAARAGLRVRELPVRLIYNDPTRHFGGILDDPAVRFAHYLEVLNNELASSAPAADQSCGSPPGPRSGMSRAAPETAGCSTRTAGAVGSRSRA